MVRGVGTVLLVVCVGCGESEAQPDEPQENAEGSSTGVDEPGTTGGEPGSSGGEETGDDSAYDVWELRFDDYSVLPVETSYVCFEFTTSVDNLRHIVGFNPVIDNAAHVHHYVVSLLDAPSGKSSPYNCLDANGDLIWGWAPGQGEYLYPPEAGFLAGENAAGQVTIRIQVHYNNPLLLADQTDNSGLDVYMTSNLRPHNAGTLVFADVGGIMIPPGEPAFEWIADCTSEQSAAILRGPITVFGSSLHAHDLGRVLWTDILRNDELVAELNRDDPFAFDSQTYKSIEGMQIEPGDAVINHCIYDSTERDEVTWGGPGTSDEMCWNTVMYYPRENASWDFCGGSEE
jgi:dopamine beta-monooxygenase